MLTIENLTARYGISDRALRRRLDALGPLIAPHIHRGQNNALLFDDGALAILDRLMQVQRETGLGLTEAVERIKSELAHSDPGTAEERPKSVHSSADPAVFTKLIAAYEDRIESLERDKAYLQAKLDEALAKLPALPPPRPINLTRWQALKIALLGRS
jgi:DNA-binding transcriptional MerR regulator